MAALSGDPADLSVVEAASAIGRGALSGQALTDACLARIAEREPEIKAWQHLDPNAARRAAATPLAGTLSAIPFGVKEVIETHDYPTGHGVAFYHDHRPARDAGCVALLREAGGILLGKTAATELGHLSPTITRNPVQTDHTPGGSSSGSAAAVAAGMVPFAIGTQTTGSTLRPASFCGIVGYKPTFGDVTLSGVFEASASFDTLGVLCRAIEDLPVIRAALMRQPVQAVDRPDLSVLRLGTWRNKAWESADRPMQAAIEGALERWSAGGATVVELTVPSAFEAVNALHRSVAGFEFARAAAFERNVHGDALSETVREGRMRDGEVTTLDEYFDALDELARLRIAIAAEMELVDLVVTPAALGEAPRGTATTGDPVLNTIWTALHLPALTFPAGSVPSGLPLGVQLVGAKRSDARLIAAAQTLESAITRPYS